jgi:hypothetical protein
VTYLRRSPPLKPRKIHWRFKETYSRYAKSRTIPSLFYSYKTVFTRVVIGHGPNPILHLHSQRPPPRNLTYIMYPHKHHNDLFQLLRTISSLHVRRINGDPIPDSGLFQKRRKQNISILHTVCRARICSRFNSWHLGISG